MNDILREVETLLKGMEKAGKHCQLVESTGLQRNENPHTGLMTLSFAMTFDVTQGPEQPEAKAVKAKKVKAVDDAPADSE